MDDLLRPFVRRSGAAVLDGGLATELSARGVSLDDPLWSARALLDAPDVVAAVHRDYLEAGADVVTTATYQASFQGLTGRGLSEAEAERFFFDAVALACRERDAFAARSGSGHIRPLVAASLGPYGAFLADGSEYRGDYGIDARVLTDWHRPRLRALERCGADLLAFETIPSLAEIEAIAELLVESDGPPAWVSLQARDASHLADGSPVEGAAAITAACERIFAVGVNCVAPELVTPLLQRISTATAKPLVAYPNRGDRWDLAKRCWVARSAPAAFDRLAPAWRAAGARLIGGCCCTTPGDIRTIAAAL